MTPPDGTIQHWRIREADNSVRICLTERHDIGHFYTSLEIYVVGENWRFVEGSACAHGTDHSWAESRVRRLLDGEWESIVSESKEHEEVR